jgi:hypothetical protein
MSPSSSKPPSPHLLQVDIAATTNGSSGASSLVSSGPSPRLSPAGGSESGNGGQNQACAACKYQRRKCSPDCPLARYFPADQQRRFLNAHRLFGVSNIQKTLRRIDPEYGPEAMRALIYQSEARAVDPVYGCVRIIKQLEHEAQVRTAELNTLRHQIAIYRQVANNAGAGDHQLADPSILSAPGQQDNVASMTMDALYGGGGADQELPAVHHQAGGGFVVAHDQQQQHYNALNKAVDAHQQAQLYDYLCYDGTAADEATSHDASTVQDYCYSDASVVKAGSPLTSLGEQLGNHCHIQDLPVTIAGHGSGVQQQSEEAKVAATVVKYDHADQKVPATAQCHLELGYPSAMHMHAN